MAYVNINYGPYEACGIVKHRTERLRGLQKQLELRGHTVELIPSPHWDRVEVELGRRHVFRCRVTSLEFDTDGEDDDVCQRAVAVVEHFVELLRPEFLYPNIPLFSVEFFAEVIDEAFRKLDINAYIDDKFDKSLKHARVLDCIPVPKRDVIIAAEFKRFLGAHIDETLRRDLNDDLVRENLEDYFEMGLVVEGSVLESIETREFVKGMIHDALSQTHADIQTTIDAIVDSVVNATLGRLDPRRPESRNSIASLIADARNLAQIPSMRSIISEILQKSSFRSLRSMSVASPMPPLVEEDSDEEEEYSEFVATAPPYLASQESRYLGGISYEVDGEMPAVPMGGREVEIVQVHRDTSNTSNTTQDFRTSEATGK